VRSLTKAPRFWRISGPCRSIGPALLTIRGCARRRMPAVAAINIVAKQSPDPGARRAIPSCHADSAFRGERLGDHARPRRKVSALYREPTECGDRPEATGRPAALVLRLSSFVRG
jgi:hypothetical protein